MRLERTIERLRSDDRTKLLQAARDLSRGLSSNNLAQLAEFRSNVAAIGPNEGDRFADGVRAALLEVAAAYEAEIDGAVVRLLVDTMRQSYEGADDDTKRTLSKLGAALGVTVP